MFLSSAQSNHSNQAGGDWTRIPIAFFSGLWSLVFELYQGVRLGTVPLLFCLNLGTLACVSHLVGLDRWTLRFIRLSFLYPESQIYHYIYWFGLVTCGFWIWAVKQALIRARMLRRLTKTFATARLKNGLGKYPGFISDTPVDEYTRCLKVTAASLPLKGFQESKPYLEMGLQVYVDEIRENRRSGTIEIIYSHFGRFPYFELGSLSGQRPDHLIIGQDRAHLLEIDIKKIPHILIAGSTGGGKSTFLKHAITSFYVNNPTYQFSLIDLKQGVEFQLFENLKRVRQTESAEQAITELERIHQDLEGRYKILKANSCKDLEDFGVIAKEQIVYPGGTSKTTNMGRRIVVVDEAAELLMAGALADTKQVQKAKRLCGKIAAQGRACGIHLLIGTQRPDRFAVDPHIKANLPGRLCYRMSNNASSMTVLDSGRAASLPEISGRAIWKAGGKMSEVQAPNFLKDKAEELLKAHRIQRGTKKEKEPSADKNLFAGDETLKGDY